MEQGQPDVIEQLPAGGSPNQPASGTYGEVADLDRLKQALPVPQGPTAPSPTPMPAGGGRPPVPGPTPGLPQGILAPSRQPGVPVQTPLEQGFQPAQTRSAQVVQQLHAVMRDPNVSDMTREFAELLLDRLTRA